MAYGYMFYLIPLPRRMYEKPWHRNAPKSNDPIVRDLLWD